MGIIKLLTAVGEVNIMVQNLSESMVSIDMTKRGSRVAFHTDQISAREMMTGDSKMIGLIVWLPREQAERVMAESKE